MRLTVLGCSGSGPGPTSPASGYLITAGDTRLLLDLGNGSFGALQRHLDPWLLDAVVLSHLHADHCADMTNLVVHRRYHPLRPRPSRHCRCSAPPTPPTRLAARLRRVAGGAGVDGPVRRAGVPQGGRRRRARRRHAADGAGRRIRSRRTPCASSTAAASLVYSGDTGPCAALVELAAGADVLLCEASWPHVVPGRWTEPPGGLHMSGRQAGEHAAAAGVGRLLLTHVPTWCDPAALLAEAQERFDGPVELVAPRTRPTRSDDRRPQLGSELRQTAAEPAWPIQTTRPVTTSPASAASTPEDRA